MLLIASTSGYFGKKWTDEGRALKGSLTKMNKEMADAKASLTILSEKLTPDAKTLSLGSAVSATMLDAFNLRVPDGITLTGMAPGKQGGGTDMRQLTQISDDVPGTSLKSVKVNLTGTYKTYEGLMAYLEALQKGPVAVSHLKVQEQSFEASLRIFGVQEK